MLKLSEEVGEVSEAVIGATGQNPRKGITHTWDDVEAELCDVVITALVALGTLTPQAREVFVDTCPGSRNARGPQGRPDDAAAHPGRGPSAPVPTPPSVPVGGREPEERAVEVQLMAEHVGTMVDEPALRRRGAQERGPPRLRMMSATTRPGGRQGRVEGQGSPDAARGAWR